MSESKKQVLVVDDSEIDLVLLDDILSSTYEVITATNGEQALQLVAESCPDAILLDVVMPGMDGYETCRRLKQDLPDCDVDVIFVSVHDSVEEKLHGYDAGGSDYLVKPVIPDELQRKLVVAISNRLLRQQAAEQQGMAMQTAMTAITNAGELGVVIDFMRRSFIVNSLDELADLIIDANRNYGLESSVQLRTAARQVSAGSKGPVAPLEQELLTRLQDAGRIMEKGSRLILNFGNVSLLIKNMPDDSDKCGRLRDHLAILMEGAEARLHALEIQQEIARVIADSNRTLHDIEAMQQEQKQNAIRILDDVLADLEASFMSYGMNEEQEELLLDVVRDGTEKAMENFEQGLSIDEQLRDLVEQLKQVQAG
ncbi:MAG: response regulator [Chromatiales bacterium]|jgi:CheY-like chemotaxis protein